MPLQQGSSDAVVSANIKEMQAKGHPHDQAVAAALHNADKSRRRLAVGGVAADAQGGWWQRNQADPVIQHGLIPHPTPGRADAHNYSVPADTYIIPADVVSAFGDGNTAAGAAKLDLRSAAATREPGFRPQVPGSRPLVPVKLSGGEYAVAPPVVAHWGHGDMDFGHDVLDAMVKKTRKDNVKTLKNLPGPVR